MSEPYLPAPVPVEVVLPYARLAAREGVSVKRDAGTRWWATRNAHGDVIAFAGLWCGTRLERFKGAWTRPDYRGSGHGLALVETVLAAADPTKALEVIHRVGGDTEFWPRHGLPYTGTDRHNGGRVYRRPAGGTT